MRRVPPRYPENRGPRRMDPMQPVRQSALYQSGHNGKMDLGRRSSMLERSSWVEGLPNVFAILLRRLGADPRP